MLTLASAPFSTTKVVFLGFVVSGQGVEMDKEKIKAIREYLPPQNLSQVRSSDLLVSTGDLSKISAPMQPQSMS
jgi:hypothetical protein